MNQEIDDFTGLLSVRRATGKEEIYQAYCDSVTFYITTEIKHMTALWRCFELLDKKEEDKEEITKDG